MDSGPMGSTARLTAVNSTVVWRDWPAASMGMANRSWLSPMGRSPRADVVGVRPGLSTQTSTFTVSDTVHHALHRVESDDVLQQAFARAVGLGAVSGQELQHGTVSHQRQREDEQQQDERHQRGDGERRHRPAKRRHV